LILDAIDIINVITSQGFIVAIATEEAGQNWEEISGYLYQLLGKGARKDGRVLLT
jgi:ryanodine receptor 2